MLIESGRDPISLFMLRVRYRRLVSDPSADGSVPESPTLDRLSLVTVLGAAPEQKTPVVTVTDQPSDIASHV